MSKIRDFLNSLFGSTKERLNNPMISAFIIAWIPINWKLILALIYSQKTIENKIVYIQEDFIDLKFNFYLPLLAAVFYVSVLPFLMALFEWMTQTPQAIRSRILKKQVLENIRLNQEIAAEEWQLEKIKNGSKDSTKLTSEVENLKNQVQEKENRIQELLNAESDGRVETSSKPPSKKRSTASRKKVTPKETVGPTPIENKEYPILKEIVLRDLPKTEREWILVYGLYSSDNGTKMFTRDDLMRLYDESGRRTQSRIANLSNNMKSLVKSGQLKYINDDDLMLSDSGAQTAKEVLNR
jgi:hypothetical protein